ncbi:hypothetical protein EBX31_10275 [bacterium]|nr:hypothetical protein [bacterium]
MKEEQMTKNAKATERFPVTHHGHRSRRGFHTRVGHLKFGFALLGVVLVAGIAAAATALWVQFQLWLLR